MKFKTRFNGKIYQVTEALSYGDAVSNQILEIESVLIELGFDASIHCKWWDERLTHNCKPLESLEVSENDIIIFHYYGFAEHTTRVVIDLYCTKVLVYHNITPKEYFEKGSNGYEFCNNGRLQLASIVKKFNYHWADSEYNLEELISLGINSKFACIVPIIVDRNINSNSNIIKAGGIWIFVGRIARSKNQHQLIEAFIRVKKELPEAASHLYIIGGFQDEKYLEEIKYLISNNSCIADSITITSKVSDEERDRLYSNSSIYVSCSLHEGFGVPLIEAAAAGLPVFALSNSAISETMGNSSGLSCDLYELVDNIKLHYKEESLIRDLLEHQYNNLKRFGRRLVSSGIYSALEGILPVGRVYKTVSIIVCTLDRIDYLRRLIDYIGYQSSPYFELVIVDGPSKDGTKEFLQQFNNRCKIAHNDQKNLSISRNIGIALASGDIVAFIDDDAIPFDDWVHEILECYNSMPLSFKALGGPVFYSGSLKWQIKDIAIDRYANTIPNADEGIVGKNGFVRSLIGTNSTFVREHLVSIGGFDEEYDYFLDESELCWRIQEAGGLICYSEKVLLRHEFAQSGNRISKYNYNWNSIVKNTVYYIGTLWLDDINLFEPYITKRIFDDRIAPLNQAFENGEIQKAELENYTNSINQGIRSGLDRVLQSVQKLGDFRDTDSYFLPFVATKSKLRTNTDIKKLHVCIISKEFQGFGSRGGIGTLFYHLTSELILMGHSVTIVMPSSHDHELQQGPFRIIYRSYKNCGPSNLDPGFANNFSWSVQALHTVTELHSKHNIDIVESALWDSEALAYSFVNKANRPPLVVRLVTPFPVAVKMNEWSVPEEVYNYFFEAEKNLIKNADAVVPISRSILNTIQKTHNITADVNWKFIPCGISYWPSFDVSDGYNLIDPSIKIPLTVFKDSKIIVFFGRLERRKGVDLIFKSADKILSSDQKAVLVFCGNDIEGWEERISSFVSIDNRNRVHFTGEVTDAAREKILSRAYFAVFPSRYESFGLVPLEAFVHGVPVIASNSGAIPEVVLDNRCGLLFESDDHIDLGQKAIRLLLDVNLRENLSSGARKQVRHLSSRNMASRTIELYNSLIN